jgi:hypothetical protein
LLADPALSQDRIDDAPEVIRALFRDFEISLVLAALTAQGINDDPSKFTPSQLAEGCEQARILLQAEMRRREKDLLGQHGTKD